MSYYLLSNLFIPNRRNRIMVFNKYVSSNNVEQMRQACHAILNFPQSLSLSLKKKIVNLNDQQKQINMYLLLFQIYNIFL